VPTFSHYRILARYGSTLGVEGQRYRHFEPDTVVELDDQVAEWIARDSPGVIEPVTDPDEIAAAHRNADA
jgi:hypothetical protein